MMIAGQNYAAKTSRPTVPNLRFIAARRYRGDEIASYFRVVPDKVGVLVSREPRTVIVRK